LSAFDELVKRGALPIEVARAAKREGRHIEFNLWLDAFVEKVPVLYSMPREQRGKDDCAAIVYEVLNREYDLGGLVRARTLAGGPCYFAGTLGRVIFHTGPPLLGGLEAGRVACQVYGTDSPDFLFIREVDKAGEVHRPLRAGWRDEL